MKKFLFILISFVLGLCNCLALCSNSKLAQTKKEVTNINYSVDYYELEDRVYYNIYINNITNNMCFEDNIKHQKYCYSDTNNGEFILSDYYSDYISLTFYGTGECGNKTIINKIMKLPIYNVQYKNELCRGLENLNVCKKWVSNKIDYENFIEVIDQYKYKEIDNDLEKEYNVEVNYSLLDKIINFYIKYYYIILGLTIVVCVVTIIIYNKKNNFKL